MNLSRLERAFGMNTRSLAASLNRQIVMVMRLSLLALFASVALSGCANQVVYGTSPAEGPDAPPPPGYGPPPGAYPPDANPQGAYPPPPGSYPPPGPPDAGPENYPPPGDDDQKGAPPHP
jgi:hypothetical protein